MLNPHTDFEELGTVKTFNTLFGSHSEVILSDVFPKVRNLATLPSATVWCADERTARKVPLYIWLDISEQDRKHLNAYAAVQLLGRQIVETITFEYPHLVLTPKEYADAPEKVSLSALYRTFAYLLPRAVPEPRQTLKRLRGQTELSITVEDNVLLEVFSLGHPSLANLNTQSDHLSIVTGQLFFNSEPALLHLSSSRCDLKEFFNREQLITLVQGAFGKLFKKAEVVRAMVSNVLINVSA